MRRVVITGMGIWSCLGKNKEEVAISLREGRSGIGIQPERTEYGYRSPLTGMVEKPQLKGLLDRKLRMYLAEEGEYAYMATLEAFKQAGVDDTYLLENEVGVLFGNDSSAKAVIDSHETILEKKDTTLVGSAAIFQSMNSTVTMNLSTIFHLKGINMTISAACASGSHCLQDMVLCGGAQETNYLSMGSFDGISAFSTRVNEPTKASRPFDKDRDGLVPSGGAAALVLEDYDHAVARGATILAEVCGYGFSSNGESHISQPSEDGCFRAMTRAMNEAGVKAEDVDYVNAHATSTPQGDMFEALALKRLFGSTQTPISSIVYSILMMQGGFIAPNINFEYPDEYSEGLNIVNTTTNKELKTILSNSFGFGGTNSALVIRNIKLNHKKRTV